MRQDIIIYNNTELYRITTDEFVYAKASGNYMEIFLTHPDKDKGDMQKATLTVTLQLGKVAVLIAGQLLHSMSPIARLGNSYILNMDYVFHIKPREHQLVLRDWSGRTYSLTGLPEEPLRKLKSALMARVAREGEDVTTEGEQKE